MAVKIRLRRTGRKKQPSYRLVVADTATPRDGQYLDSVGTYNPLTNPADLRIDLEKVDSWLARGAGMTDTVASLIRKARSGGDRKVAIRGVGPDETRAAPAVETPAAPAAAPKAGSRGAPKAAVVEEAPVEPPAAEPSAAAPAAEPSEPAAERATAADGPGATSPVADTDAAGPAEPAADADGAARGEPAAGA